MTKTLRLLIPQWQGGNNPDYAFGARLLAWLAPGSSQIVEVPTDNNYDQTLPIENGILAESALLKQIKQTAEIIVQHQPEKIIIFGGDCSIDQAPFDYLNGRYGDNLGILWLDAHPDISTPDYFEREHAMVLGNLLGKGAPSFAKLVEHPLKPHQVMFAGLQEMLPYEKKIVEELDLKFIAPNDLIDDSQPVIDWIKEISLSF